MSETASLALLGGRIHSPVAQFGPASAIAISGDQVAAIGTDDEIRELVGPRTRLIDLRGRLVLPSFGDAHVHAVGGGLESLRCNLLGLRTRDECLETIKSFAETLAPDAWVLGGGWALEAFPGGVVATDLDGVCGGRPAFLPNRDHHSAWVNSAALERAGLGSDTPDPFDGRIERDVHGRATGALHDGAMSFVGRIVPAPTSRELAAAVSVAQSKLHALGITHWQDACVGSAPELGLVDTYDAYRTAAIDGRLSASVVGALWWDRNRGLEQIPELLTRREGASTGPFKATAVKVMLDGVCETATAAMSKPYLGLASASTDHRGNLFLEPDLVAAAVAALDAEGFQVHFHAIGDRAVSLALDALEALPIARRGLGRHHIAHLQFIAPSDINRFEPLGAIANFQPLWACSDPQMEEFTIPLVGAERAGWQYSIGTLLASGAKVAFGSDWPVSSPDPLQEIHVAVNRTLSNRLGRAGTDECERPFRFSEALTVDSAIDAFTKGVAFVNHEEHRLGSLVPGSRADLIALDQDIFQVDRREIGSTSVALTVASGRVVHGDE
jgi:predicted amidohydrolase YtcJ